jgi:hypothetical protein
MKRAYDSKDADRLIPLLRSVQRELRERGEAVRRLEQRQRRTPREQRSAPEYAALAAHLATHKLEIRLAKKELERLGCLCDDQHPHRILIPGATGELTFSWSFGDTRVQAQVADGAA